jgi:hypothetical protein
VAKKKRKPLKSGIPKVGCPFCFQWLPAPKSLHEMHVLDSPGGRCACGAYFVVDVTGRSGGQALLDLQTLACGGDLDLALKLREDEDFELKSKPVRDQPNSRGRVVQGHSYMQPRVWALKLEREPEA